MNSKASQPELLTYKQIAAILNISLGTARKLFDDGELHRVKVSNRSVRGSKAELEAFIQRRTRPTI
jgi:excisionase family DNA binding protein